MTRTSRPASVNTRVETEEEITQAASQEQKLDVPLENKEEEIATQRKLNGTGGAYRLEDGKLIPVAE